MTLKNRKLEFLKLTKFTNEIISYPKVYFKVPTIYRLPMRREMLNTREGYTNEHISNRRPWLYRQPYSRRTHKK